MLQRTPGGKALALIAYTCHRRHSRKLEGKTAGSALRGPTVPGHCRAASCPMGVVLPDL